jgi:hypothetical protein
MITRLKLSTVTQGLPKYRSMLAGNDAFIPSSYESIASASGTGSSDTITFTSIPSTYQSLQLRCIQRGTGSVASLISYRISFNSVGGTSYDFHELTGDGSSASAAGFTNDSSIAIRNIVDRGLILSNTMTATIIDIHDYASTTRNKTVRYFAGFDSNSTSGRVTLGSGLFRNTAAISSITITNGGINLSTTSQFALYGIKGA